MEKSVNPDQYGRRGSRHGLSIRCASRCQKGGTTASCRSESGRVGRFAVSDSCTMRNAQAAASTGVVTHQPDELAQSVFQSCDIFMGIPLRGEARWREWDRSGGGGGGGVEEECKKQNSRYRD